MLKVCRLNKFSILLIDVWSIQNANKSCHRSNCWIWNLVMHFPLKFSRTRFVFWNVTHMLQSQLRRSEMIDINACWMQWEKHRLQCMLASSLKIENLQTDICIIPTKYHASVEWLTSIVWVSYDCGNFNNSFNNCINCCIN